MTRSGAALRVAAALALIGAFVGCTTPSKGVQIWDAAQPVFFDGRTAIEPPTPPADRTGLIRDLGARAEALIGNANEKPETQVSLALVAGLSHFWFGEWGEAARYFQVANAECNAGTARTAENFCGLAHDYGIYNVGLELLSGEASPRAIRVGTELNGAQWGALATVATRYREAVFDEWAAPGEAGAVTASSSRDLRRRGLCSYVVAFNALPSWRVTAGDEAAREQAAAEVQLTALQGLSANGVAGPAQCTNARDGACQQAAWTAARDACR